MPKDTFFNLPEEKRAKIYAAAFDEFAEHNFSDASINRIIKNAAIPRGSFYQYFTDKEDLYCYIILEIGRAKLDFIYAYSPLSPDMSFYETYVQMMEGGLHWSEAQPQFFQIVTRMNLDDILMISGLLTADLSLQTYQHLSDLLDRDKAHGLIRSTVDNAILLEMLSVLMIHLSKTYLLDLDSDRLRCRFMGYFDLIMHGVSIENFGEGEANDRTINAH